jgi:hypothetical protein
MSVASFVLACALDLMGRSAAQLPAIILVSEPPADASPQAVAFVREGERAIYLLESSAPFQAAMESNRERHRCRQLDQLRLVASVLAHEEWHIHHGPDEVGAYYAQLTELQRLGAGPGRWAYESVRRAMEATRKRDEARLRDARRIAASNRSIPDPTIPSAVSASDRLWPRGAQELSRLPAPPP